MNTRMLANEFELLYWSREFTKIVYPMMGLKRIR